MATKEPPLDEVQWRAPPIAHHFQGIHSNSVLFYFAESPFFDRQSNNGIYVHQAQFNPQMAEKMLTREQFEGVLSQIPNGVEFRVAQAPADMVNGTGVWVIVKQEKERGVGITPLAHYFVVGENVYQAPTFADIMSSRVESIAENMRKVLPAIDSVRRWSPSLGHSYEQPPAPASDMNRTGHGSTTKDNTTPAAGGANTTSSKPNGTSPFATKRDRTALDRLAEESFAIHMRHGGDYIDENPITGRPGEFHLSSTGRKDKTAAAAPPPPAATTQQPPKPTLLTKIAEETKKEAKQDKSPKTPGAPKPKRKKSKMSSAAGGGGGGGGVSAAATPLGGSAATTPAPS
ncbi:MED6-domain-containing protein [Sodiomyces alkalinus F11]|uniref:Mediator of RNA polymerase II transcription subunit 6 n=1 Tax=Sodiomyces alkalinus (strain CBS 110278 / VKM F-3762 / F11) TaxID=1314773 RepID=A0A3N2Q5S8_SODAK|nr:MED6-domain-containing protein [Sodiomyces alkalinus F11]ROT42131.1 MED6-domain-containing protein [Sodiomyces alkalinus F11]